MGKVYDEIDADMDAFIGRQHVFFVGTAPDSPDGHLNVSPKGLDSFRILGPKSVAYLDLTGSGIETYAVPLYEYQRERGQLIDYAERKGPEELVRYRAEKNRASIDGLAGLRSAGGEER